MPQYRFTGRLYGHSAGCPGGYSDEELKRGYQVSLHFAECKAPERLADILMHANKGMPVMTITIDVPDGVVAGPQAREVMEAVAMMEAAMEGVDA